MRTEDGFIELERGDIYYTDSVYQLKNFLLSKNYSLRILYLPKEDCSDDIGYWVCTDMYAFIHDEVIDALKSNGFIKWGYTPNYCSSLYIKNHFILLRGKRDIYDYGIEYEDSNIVIYPQGYCLVIRKPFDENGEELIKALGNDWLEWGRYNADEVIDILDNYKSQYGNLLNRRK